MINPGYIHDYIDSKIPNVIEGIGMTNPIRVDYKASATEEQRQAVAALMASLDLIQLEAENVYRQTYDKFDVKTKEIEAAGFVYNGGTFHADPTMIANMQSMMIASGYISYPTGMYDQDFTWYFQNAGEIAAMGAAVMAFVAGVRNTAKPLRDSLKQQDGESSSAWLARLQTWTDPRLP